MTESFPSAVRGWWRPGARFLFRTGAPHAGGVAVPAHRAGDRRGWPAAGARWPVCGTAGLLVPGGSRSRPAPGAGAVVRRPGAVADRQGALPAAGARGAGQRPGPEEQTAASDPGLWLDVAHAVVVLPVALVTSVVTALWWFVGLAAATFALRHPLPVRRVAAAHDPVRGQRPVPHRREPGADVAGRAARLRDRGRPAAAAHPAAGDPGVRRRPGRAGAGAAI